MNRLKEKYVKKVIPAMKEKFGYANDLSVPKLVKASINVGVGKGKDAKFLEVVKSSIARITGQRPVETKAKKSISNFKIREGMVVGVKVTVRGEKMYDFIDKIISIVLPRVRDFHGLNPFSVDKGGNLTIGFEEHLIFPEIKPEEIETQHGLEVTLTTNAKSSEEGLQLFTLMGFPFKKD